MVHQDPLESLDNQAKMVRRENLELPEMRMFTLEQESSAEDPIGRANPMHSLKST